MLNQTVLVGRLVRDPELRETENGHKVTNITLFRYTHEKECIFMKKLSSKRAKALDISQTTKKRVFERDKGQCVVCGNNYNVMPNSHYIKRSQNGLGVEQNIFTACTNFTENKCHMRYEQNKLSEEELNKIINNFKLHYPNWNVDGLKYKKYEFDN